MPPASTPKPHPSSRQPISHPPKPLRSAKETANFQLNFVKTRFENWCHNFWVLAQHLQLVDSSTSKDETPIIGGSTGVDVRGFEPILHHVSPSSAGA